jgi:AcrR family transcriptional regulator
MEVVSMALHHVGTDVPEGVAGPTLPADRRRDDMLRAALYVIADRGFTDARIADVAERAGTSPALVIYYFRSKDNLLTEAIRLAEDHLYDQGVRRIRAIPDAVGRLEEVVSWICFPPSDDEFPDPWSLWIDLWARAQRHLEVARVRQEFDVRWRNAIAQVVIDGQAGGEFQATDPIEFAITLLAMLDGLAVQIALGDPAVDAAFALRAAMGFASGVLGASWSGDKVGAYPNRS